MRVRFVLPALLLAAQAVTAAPAPAEYLPSVCNLVGTATGSTALVAGEPAAVARAVAAAGGRVVGRIHELGVLQVSFGTRAARDATLPAVARAPGVRVAEPERVYTVHRTPNDRYYAHQWGLRRIAAPKAWDLETGSRRAVTVAILDTGVALKHPDLSGRVVAGPDVANDDDDPSDDHGHGTHVAGIVGARTNNRVGVAGLSWGAQLLAVKVLGSDGSGSDCDVVLGMVRATDAGAQVLNLSLGAEGLPCGVVTQWAVDYARDAGAVVVASAGNNAQKGNQASSPANCARVLSVGATDSADKVARFSHHGADVDVSAPGDAVVSTGWDAAKRRNAYAVMSGTSMAAPHVAGLAALLLARHPTWTPDQVMDRIVRTADDRGVRGRDDFYGAGRINAARALG